VVESLSTKVLKSQLDLVLRWDRTRLSPEVTSNLNHPVIL